MSLRKSINCFFQYFESQGYKVVPIKVTDVFDRIAVHLPAAEELVPSPEASRLQTYIKYGNQLREVFDHDALLASLTIARIVQERTRLGSNNGEATAKVAIPEKNVFLLYQFKRREEIDLLRSVYGRAFFQVSVYSRRGASRQLVTPICPRRKPWQSKLISRTGRRYSAEGRKRIRSEAWTEGFAHISRR
jgi:hypothetical protein